MTVKTRRKLIEVALPLDDINTAAAREKSIRHGHPSTLHLWWARRPLAAARAVLFAQLVDDPSAVPEEFPTEAAQEAERQRLFRLIARLVQWENTTNEAVLEEARAEILRSWRRACADNAGHPRAAELFNPDRLPPFWDPFAGGGSLPLEAQRLGLEAHASDLNPVAVLICKAMIEIPPRFAGQPPVHPGADRHRHWKGAQGLAEDVRHYGAWMRDEVGRRIGHLYPKIAITPAMVEERPDLKPYLGRELTVIAWLWARTVRSPNPAFAEVPVPLVSSFVLSAKPGREAWVEPVVEGGGYRFRVRVGKPPAGAKGGTTAGKRAAFRCLMSGAPVTYDHIRAEGQAGRMGARLMAIVAEGERGRVYLSPTPEHEAAARQAQPVWKPETPLPEKALGFRIQEYGMKTWADLFTDRQMVALTTFSDLVGEAMARGRADSLAAGLPDDPTPLRDGGRGATAYAEAVGMYLAIAVSRLADISNALCRWEVSKTQVRNLFGRQAIPMIWDFAENNLFGEAAGDYGTSLENMAKALCALPAKRPGRSPQIDATNSVFRSHSVVSADPPYFDNIGYADLSDFFYVWLRRSLRPVFPDLFATLATPKDAELIAFSYRHGSKEAAERFFLEGMGRALANLSAATHSALPATLYYAFKQSETDGNGETTSTGWETFLEAVIRAGFTIDGTWPLRTEAQSRMRSQNSNALASSIVLACRPRPADAPTATRREFLTALRAELPTALRTLQHGNIAPVDLAQAAIGPGMAVFTRYTHVLDAQGNPLSVRDALALINATLDEVLAEQEGDFDSDSRWALAWYDQHGFAEGDFGVAETLSKAKNTSVSGLAEAGILESRRGKVRLKPPAELPADWDPAADRRLTVWEATHHLIRTLESGGETAAAALAAKLRAHADAARELAYRLYLIADRRKRAAEALSYNGLVQSWPEIARLAREGGTLARDLF